MFLARNLLFVFLLIFLVVNSALAVTVTDSAGREVQVPDEITRVFASGPPASIITYVLTPDKLVGWPRPPRPYERPYIAEPYRDLPETGRLTGRGGTANLEVVINSQPDLIIDFGSIRDTYISLADRVQDQTGIPYILIDGRFDNTPTAFRLLGQILGVPERGEALARYTEQLFEALDSTLASIAEEQRPWVYLARGPAGLETGLKGSINTEIIERAGGRNIADPGDSSVRRGIVQASIEQVIASDPEVIITWDEHFFNRVWTDPFWSGISAVQHKKVYFSPTAPFGWIDRPPSVNRIMGLRWLAGLFYPNQFEFDLKEDAREFYKLFYHVELSNVELNQLIAWASSSRTN